MVAKVENFGIIDYTYENLRVDGVEIKTNMEMAMTLKGTGWFRKYTLFQLQEWGYDRMYQELIHKLEEKGLA